MMVIRVETDWYVHETEFRYVLQPGETISASHSLPIGQVLFVPREEIILRDGTEEQAAARLESSTAFFHEKKASKVRTAYGLEYSPHYQRTSRMRNAGSKAPEAGADTGSTSSPETPPEAPKSNLTPKSAIDPSATAPAPSRKVGRNDLCPCGSGRKYKKCHGEASSSTRVTIS
jgi:hypothetical protein